MGCFDEMVPKKQNWKCWNCGREFDRDYTLKKQVFQTKELGEHLMVFKEGEKLFLKSSEIDCTLGNGTLIAYDFCSKSNFDDAEDDGCNHMNYFKLKISDGIWISTMQFPKSVQKKMNR